jgi:3-hydroxy acid dehydrogenase/malonic semialdehyde reductase
MSNRLRGKTILITGGSAGIGRSTAFEFARTCPFELKIIITGRRKAPLEKCAADITREVGDGVKVLPVVLDVSDFAAIAGFVASLPEGWREIDILVNNAGLARGMERAPDIEVEDMDLTFDTNIIGLVHMTQAVLPGMLRRGEFGQGDVISLGSIAGQDPYPGGSIYCATKTAIRSFSEALRKELIATRIRVIQIDPGQVETVRGFKLFMKRGEC